MTEHVEQAATELVSDLNRLARALEQGQVTPDEAAARLRVLAGRVRPLVARVEEQDDG